MNSSTRKFPVGRASCRGESLVPVTDAKPPARLFASLSRKPWMPAGRMPGAVLLMVVVAFCYAASPAAAGAPQAASGPEGPASVSLVIRNVYALAWRSEAGSVWPRAEVSAAPVDIAVAGDRIAAIGPALAERHPQARIVDGQGGYAIPGLIDVHVHAGASETGPNVWPLLVDIFSMGRIKGAHALDAGVTTLRSVGDAFPGVDRMRRVWEEDPARMPRLEYVGPMFTAPGGHPVSTVFRGNPWLYRAATRQVASAPEAAFEARRVLSDSGAAPTTLKAIYSTGDGHLPRLSEEALQALVTEAAAAGAVVIAHTESLSDVMGAVESGVRGVEHGVASGERLSAAQAGRLAQAGVFYSPTLAVIEQLAPKALAAAMDNVRTAHRAGVAIVTGTDAGNPGVLYGLSVLREVELLHEAGLPPAHAVAAATYQAARYLGAEGRLGALAPGFTADVVVLARNPLEDLQALREVRLVVRSGQVARFHEGGRLDGRWQLEPFWGLDGFVVGGSVAQRTTGPVKLRLDAGYALAGRVAYRLRADLGRSLVTAAYLQAGDWPVSPVLGRQGQQGLTAGAVLAQGRNTQVRAEAGFVRLWALSGEPAAPSAAYGRLLLTHRWLFDEWRMDETSLDAVVGSGGGDTPFASLLLATSVELGELRATLKVGLSDTWGAGLQGFGFKLGGPYGSAVLRGYPAGALTGGSMAALTLDYRWVPMPDWPLGLHAFADVAAAWPSAAFGGGSDWGAAAGLGVSLSAGPFGAYRLDLAVTPSGRPTPVLWFYLNS